MFDEVQLVGIIFYVFVCILFFYCTAIIRFVLYLFNINCTTGNVKRLSNRTMAKLAYGMQNCNQLCVFCFLILCNKITNVGLIRPPLYFPFISRAHKRALNKCYKKLLCVCDFFLFYYLFLSRALV